MRRVSFSVEEKLESNVLNTHSCCPTMGIMRYLYSLPTEDKVHVLRYSPLNDLLAAGLANGQVLIFHVESRRLLFNLKESNLPPSIAWRPMDEQDVGDSVNRLDGIRTKNTLLVAFPDGLIVSWHATTGRKQFEMTLDPILTVEFSPNGREFATGGTDNIIRIYNYETKQLLETLKMGKIEETIGHSNRIFCIKFHPKDPNILMSGGWDSTIQIWDRSLNQSIKSLYHPHVCGESLDYDEKGLEILAGSHHPQDCLMVFHQSGQESIQWSILEEKGNRLYTALYSPRKKYIVAGGGETTRRNELRVFLRSNKRCVGMVSGFSGSVYTHSMTQDDSILALGGSFNDIAVYDLGNQVHEILY